MPTYLLQLGNTPELSLIELSALLPGLTITKLTDHVYSVELVDDDAANALLDRSGGLVKVARVLEHIPLDSTPEFIQEHLQEQLLALDLPKFKFGVSEWERDHLEPLSIAKLKKDLQAQGLKVRYLDGPRTGLSASILSHQSLAELIVFNTADDIIIALTVSIQNIDAWSFRDRSKPYADRKKGMLPPKVARMMVNIAVGDSDQPTGILYDPFCGTGTVLAEALLRNTSVVGSDLDSDSIVGTKANLQWLVKELSLDESKIGAIFTSDVSQVTLDRIGRPVQYLVTEPFLGKPTPTSEQLPGIFKGLEKLYLGAFKRWTKVLSPGATVAIVLPIVQDGKRIYTLESLIDKLADLGYTTLYEPVVYRRENAIVQRHIHFLRFQSN